MFKTARAVLVAGAAVMATTTAWGAEPEDRPEEPEVPVENVTGHWLTEKKGAVIDIYLCGPGKDLCGRIVWLKDPYTDAGELKRDPENPDPSLRDQPLCGLEVVTGLSRIDSDTWAHGRVYNPKDGNRYRAYLDAKDNGSVHIRGYIGLPLIGKSEDWTRPENIDVGCPET